MNQTNDILNKIIFNIEMKIISIRRNETARKILTILKMKSQNIMASWQCG
ncbi:hypothetical protein ACFLRN_03430 [Thermoproteota archaeon]